MLFREESSVVSWEACLAALWEESPTHHLRHPHRRQLRPSRTGGELEAPTLIEHLHPVYPPLAVSAQIEGVVILEATVGENGHVEDVQVLRSVGVLDRAAITAVHSVGICATTS